MGELINVEPKDNYILRISFIDMYMLMYVIVVLINTDICRMGSNLL